MITRAVFEAKKQALLREFVALAPAEQVGLSKKTSNLFRYRDDSRKHKLDVRSFNNVISVDANALVADVEGMTTYEDLVRETLRYGLLPPVVPELKSITIGGAVSGIGIESSSWRYGLVHETVQECEVLLADGTTVTCTPTNEHRDLFFGLPNSYGTLGYIVRLKIKLVRTKPFVQLRHLHFSDPQAYFSAVAHLVSAKSHAGEPFDYIDGTIFERDNLYITLGRFVDTIPSDPAGTTTSDYTYRQIYYKSIAQKQTDYLTTHDYIWRWDTDWFWCSSHFGVQNPLIRLLVGRRFLRSTTYWKIRHWYQGVSARRAKDSAEKLQKAESVVQDVEIPLKNAAAFLTFFQKKIGIKPVWMCPLVPGPTASRYELYRMAPGELYINFGFWDVVKSKTAHPDGYRNKLVEAKTAELGGKKSLYSTAYYDRETFWQLYNKSAYDLLKKKYDPAGRFTDLYQKTTQAGRAR
ncbi:MAG: FAD-binding oxidoreductase [Candidatus Andersenbacteria bacterium]